MRSGGRARPRPQRGARVSRLRHRARLLPFARIPACQAAAARKGYWIAHVDVADPEGYKAYISANQTAFGKFGARYLVRAGAREVVEGTVRGRTVVLEFPSYQAARDCYRSPEYQTAKVHRERSAKMNGVLVEGIEQMTGYERAREG